MKKTTKRIRMQISVTEIDYGTPSPQKSCND